MAAPIRAIVVSVSDTRQESTDVSGVTLVGLLLAMNAEVVEKIIVSDDLDELKTKLIELTDREDINLIFTTGGTGLSGRDNTPPVGLLGEHTIVSVGFMSTT